MGKGEGVVCKLRSCGYLQKFVELVVGDVEEGYVIEDERRGKYR